MSALGKPVLEGDFDNNGQVVVQSSRRALLQRFLPQWKTALEEQSERRVRWALDVDPAGFA